MEKKTGKAYTDGGYRKEINPDKCSWAVVVGDGQIFSGLIDSQGMNQVPGEIHAVRTALRYGMQLELDLMRIFYDYTGVEMWARKQWKANNPVTKAYQDLFREIDGKLMYGHENDDHLMEVRFIKVRPEDNKADPICSAALGVDSAH